LNLVEESTSILFLRLWEELTAPCGLVVRVPGYRSRGPGSIPCASRFFLRSGVERGPLSLVRITEALF
jgi:hypothetical protein